MPRWTDRLFNRSRKPQKAYHQLNQPDHTPVTPVSESTNWSNITKGQLEDHPLQQDLWQCAYDQLDQKARDILLRIEIPAQLGNDKNNSRTEAVINKVIQITGEQYEEYQQGGRKIQRPTGEDIDLRKFSQKTINAALSFKAIINAVVAFDPTQHAASVWAVVSLGLTMAKNRLDLRDALFSSSEYLADVLARCAFIEDNFYRINSDESAKIGHVIVRVYKAILQYTAEVLSAQNPSMGRWILDGVAAITNERLMELQSSIKEEETYLHQWVEFDQHLQHQKKAESILAGIDKMSASIQDLIQKFNILNLHMAEGALYDSYIDQHEDMCLPDTRVDLRRQITEWAELSDKCIFWLNGMAGTGKSTIARTVAQSFKERGQLGASFFFKRGEADRDTAKRLISTIIRQLVTVNRRLLPGISEALQNDPNISAKSLSEQFNKLLFEPLQILEPSQTTVMVIVIDALDECEKKHDIEILLQLLPRLQKCRSIRLQIFLTSRPELPIRLGFEKSNDHQDLVLHELPHSVIEHDIRIFLKNRFPVIKEKRKISGDWPGDDTIEDLVTMAVPLFIFAATICRFVGEGRHPEKCLQKLLNSQEVTSAPQMDKIYLPILGQVLTGSDEDESNELIREFRDIVGVIILLAAPLPVNFLARLLHVPKKDISDLLDPLHSVLSVPDDMNAPVRILHLSFRDYLLNTKSAFHVDEEKTHQRIALCCLHVLNISLTHNICSLSSYGTQRIDIHNQVINQHLSADLQYSCRYWVYHLEQSRAGISEEEIVPFLEKHFLHWLEAMSLMGAIPETVAIIDTLQSSIGSKVQSEFSQFLYDSKRFILQNIQLADTAPLQLYRSGLAFSPLDSMTRKMFGKDLCRWLHTMPQVKNSWSAELQTLEGHSDWVRSVAFSPDGKMVASGSDDGTIKIWQADTGTELQTLEGHSDWVRSVAFSPDGKTVASGSGDCTIKIWQADTGMELQTLGGHSDPVSSVAFSPDGKMVASGSHDHTIKIWQANTGTELQTLEGHSGWVQSVAFSPESDRKMVASGSIDRTIKIWQANIGTELRTLEGHSGSVQSVAFSPDGMVVASGSDDCTIKIWQADSGTELRTLEGHSGSVQSVAFSPESDGKMVASGSDDHTIKIWQADSGTELQTLEGHSSSVQSVAFSPESDGKMVASGSHDRTIKIWQADTGTELQTLEGHSSSVHSVAFSPDGTMVASGSGDRTIKIWQANTGTELRTLEGHSSSVQSVAFSPESDGKMVASGSGDYTIKIWQADTGTELRTLEGHSSWVHSVAFSPNGKMVASGSHDRTIKIWQADTGTELQTLEGHLNPVQSVAFSPDGKMVVSGSGDRTIKIWQADTGTELRTLEGHFNSVQSVASGTHDRTIKIWQADTGTKLQTLEGYSTPDQPSHQVSLEKGWVAFRGEKILWLPSEYRAFSCSATKDGALTLGYANGRVLIMAFCVPVK